MQIHYLYVQCKYFLNFSHSNHVSTVPLSDADDRKGLKRKIDLVFKDCAQQFDTSKRASSQH